MKFYGKVTIHLFLNEIINLAKYYDLELFEIILSFNTEFKLLSNFSLQKII